MVVNSVHVSELKKRVVAARKYDKATAERRNYWGELAIWSERRLGELLIEAKVAGEIQHGGDKKKQSDTLSLCLGIDSDTEARAISSRAQKLAAFENDEVEAAIGGLAAIEPVGVTHAS